MIENRPWLNALSHLVLILGVLIVAFPLWVAFVASTQTAEAAAQAPLSLLPGGHFFENYARVLFAGMDTTSGTPVGRMLANTLFVALTVALGKILISFLSAFALVYFRFPGRSLCFWLIFLTLMLPVEVRISPTYAVMADLRLLDSYAGLTLPLIASATATFLFRQFFLTIPDELAEAARIDGAGPLRFMRDVALPLSATNIAALFVILFIYGWNQYLWPLLVTSREDLYTIVISIKRMISAGDAATEWNLVMATAMLAMLPPALVVVLMQRWFIKGLVDSEK